MNFIDSKTVEADKRFLDDNYRKATSNRNGVPRNSSNNKPSNNFPDYEDL